MKKLKILIVGSNFGMTNLKAAKKSGNFKSIVICSPNINKKSLPKKIKYYQDYHEAIKKIKFDMLSIATLPNIQHEVINTLYNKKKLPKYIFLEKPILEKTLKILNKVSDKNFILTNFIFSFNKIWLLFFKNNIFDKNFLSFKYTWYFKQAYFENFNSTWKILPAEGGGLINYYLPHAIFNLLYLHEKITFKKILEVKKYNNQLIYLKLLFKLKNKECLVLISNKSKKNLHKLKLNFKNGNKEIVNETKNWLSNFNIKINDKKIFSNKKKENKYKDGRINTLVNIYSNLEFFFNARYVKNNKLLVLKTFKTIKKINKIINS